MPQPADLTSLVRSHAQRRRQTRSTDAALDLLARVEAPWRRTSFEPGHFTASGFVASPDATCVLLIHHARLDRWLQPGGHFEPGDLSVESAARREIAEETGVIDLAALSSELLQIDAHPIPARREEPQHTHVDLAVAFRAHDERIGPIDEVLDARWVRFDELDDYAVDDAVHRGARLLRDRARR